MHWLTREAVFNFDFPSLSEKTISKVYLISTADSDEGGNRAPVMGKGRGMAPLVGRERGSRD